MVWTSCKPKKRSGCQQLHKTRRKQKVTHVFLHVDVGAPSSLESDEVPQHTSHQILSVDDNLLVEVLDATGVADEVSLGQSCLDLGDKRVRDVGSRHRRSTPGVERSRDEEEVRGSREAGEGGDEVGELGEVF